MTVRPAEAPVFPLAWPPWQPPHGRGFAAYVCRTAGAEWAESLLARDADQLVVWATGGPRPEARALTLRDRPGVRTLHMVAPASDPRWVHLALRIGDALAAERDEATTTPTCLTAWTAPAVPAGAVRIPHLVTVAHDGALRDLVLWELVPVVVARLWLGTPLPDQSYFEHHLPALLRLREASRRGRLPPRAVTAGLDDVLGARALSIELVYKHADRFRPVLAQLR